MGKRRVGNQSDYKEILVVFPAFFLVNGQLLLLSAGLIKLGVQKSHYFIANLSS